MMVFDGYMLCSRCKFQRFCHSNSQEIMFVECNAKNQSLDLACEKYN